MDTFTTASGNEHSCPFFAPLESKDIIYIAVAGSDFTAAAALFSNEEEMRSIEFGGHVYSGYTHLDYMTREKYGIKAQMRRP